LWLLYQRWQFEVSFGCGKNNAPGQANMHQVRILGDELSALANLARRDVKQAPVMRIRTAACKDREWLLLSFCVAKTYGKETRCRGKVPV
jgi:hypothetical protein